MTSRFFAAASESESDSNSDNRSEVSENEEVVKKNAFYYESSSDDDQKRVVRSEKDKRHEAIRNVIDKIKDKMKIEDFVAIADEFDELNKQLEKSKKLIEKEGIPLFYIRICYVLEKFLNELSTEKKNSLKPANKKAYNTVKHKVKKNNKLYEDKIKAFGENPTYSEDEGSSSEEDTKKKGAAKKDAKAAESSDDEWKSGSEGGAAEEDSDEDDEEEDIKRFLQSNDPMVRRNYWLKRETEDKPKKEDKDKPKKPRPAKIKREFEEDLEKPKKVVYTLDELDKKIVEIVERRAGRKLSSKDKKVSVEEDLDALLDFFDKVDGEEIKRLEVLLILMPTRMDYSRQFSQYCMPRNLWLENFENLQEFYKIIKNKKNNLTQVRTFQKDGDLYYKDTSIIEAFSTHFDGLDNELHKAFKTIEGATLDYAERLRDQAHMIRLADESYTHFKNINEDFLSVKFAQKKLEYTYYLPDKLYEKLRASANERGLNTKNEFYNETNSEKLIHELATKVYTSTDNKIIIKTLLQHIYHHAVNGRYHVAKEYFLMSHIPDISANLDAPTQIIYNRTLVQLGLAAFSLGLINDAVSCLADIVSTGRIKELIGQGISRNSTNEKEEVRRLLPVHMHINTEFVDAVHLMAAMLVDTPNIITESFEGRTKQISKVYRKLYDQYKNFYGVPETYKDKIMVAGRELQRGEWKKAYQLLETTNIWGYSTQDVEKTKQNILLRVKDQAFKCYLLTIQSCYDAIDIESLAKKFEVEKDAVTPMISKLVFNREVKAYLDLDSNCLIFEKGDINKLESKALGLADRVSTLLVNNEKIMDSKYGNYGITDKDINDGLNKKRITNKKKINTMLGKDKRKQKPKRN